MKSRIKKALNKMMLRLFGHTPYPKEREQLRFIKLDVPQRKCSSHEFNAWTLHIYKQLK